MTTVAEVRLWGSRIGAVSLEEDAEAAVFAYEPAFIDSRVQVAPIMMPLQGGVFSFPDLPRRSFHGLPGMLADALPDKYGNILIDAWLATQGRAARASTPSSAFATTGQRGMARWSLRQWLGRAAGSPARSTSTRW